MLLTCGVGLDVGRAGRPQCTAERALFLCGHQDADAPGKLERLAGLDMNEPRSATLKDNDGRNVVVAVSAQVSRYNLSAHADCKGLAKIIRDVAQEEIMLVHGEPGPQ